MPFINGLEVAEIIKKTVSQDTYISDNRMDNRRSFFLKIKPDVIDEIVFKPFDLDKLVNLIKKYLAENKKNKKAIETITVRLSIFTP